jgi:putative endonuclease
LSFQTEGGIQKLTLNEKRIVYILSSKRNGTLYTGVTSDLFKRIYQHKNNIIEGFTSKFHVHNLVYFEEIDNIKTAIDREKQIKSWNRGKS